MLLGTCSCVVVRCVLCALSGFTASGGRCCLAPVRVPWLWPAACLSGLPRGPAWCAAPRPVRSLSVLQSAFPTQWCLSPPRGLAPPALLGGCAGHAEAGREPGSLCLPLAPAEAGALGSLCVVPVWGPAMGLFLAGPSGVGLGLRALRWLAYVDPVTDASGFPYHLSFDGGLGRCTGAVSCGRRHLPLRVGGRHARVWCVCACACSLWPGRAGRPPGRVLVRVTFSFGRFVFLLCLAPSGLGLPPSWSFAFVFFCFFVVFFPFFFFFFFLSPPLSLFFFGFRPRVPWALALCVVCFDGLALLGSPCALAFFVLPGRWPLSGGCPPPPLSLAAVAVPRCLALVCFFFRFFFPLLCTSLVFGFLCFPAPGALGLGAGLCLLCSALRAFFFFVPPLSVLRALSPVLCLPVGRSFFPGGCCPPPPPSPSVSRGFRRSRSVPWFFFSLSFRAPPLSPAFSGFRPRVPWALALCFVCFSRPPTAWLSVRSRLVCVSRLAVGCSPVVAAPPPPLPFCVSRFSSLLLGALVFFFFFFFLCAPPLSPTFSGFRPRVPWASTLCVVCFVGLPLLGSPCAFRSFVLSAWPLAAPWWLLPPPPFVSRGFSSLPLGAVCRVLCCAVCPWVRCCAALLRVVSPGVVLSGAVMLCCARLVPLLVAPCPLALPVALGPCALRRCVLRCSPALCALCRVCFVVARWCVLLFAALLCTVCVPGCSAVRSLSSPLCAVLCFAVLVRSRCAVPVVHAVAGAWCCGALLCVVLFLLVCRGAVLGLVSCGCLLVACFGVSAPVWPRGLLPCGCCGLLWCPTFLCRWRFWLFCFCYFLIRCEFVVLSLQLF